MNISKRFVGFIIASGIAALVNFLSRILLNYIFSYEISIVIAYIFGMVTAFFLNKVFVFKPNESLLLRRAIFFTLVNMVSILLTLGVSLLLNYHLLPMIGWNFYRAEVAHFIGIVLPAITSYYGHKWLTFKN